MNTTKATASDWSSRLDIKQCLDLMRKAIDVAPRGPSPIGTLLLTHRQAEEFRKYAGDHSSRVDDFSVLNSNYHYDVGGIEIVEVEPMPRRIRTGRIIQKDRFAEYGPDDMAWAEPLGLAEWETVDRESVMLGITLQLQDRINSIYCGALAGEMCFSSAKSDAETFSRILRNRNAETRSNPGCHA